MPQVARRSKTRDSRRSWHTRPGVDAAGWGSRLSALDVARLRRAGPGHRLPHPAGALKEKEAPVSRPALDLSTAPHLTRTLPTWPPARSTADFEEVAIVLAQMNPEERVRAYASGVFTLRELSAAAAVRPDLMPIVNGEYEWIALTAE